MKNFKDVWLNYTPPKWLPKWQHTEEYPGAKTSKKDFAWEFLRRNPDYQQDFKNICEACQEENVQNLYITSSGYNLFHPIYKDLKISSRFFHDALYGVLSKWGLAYLLPDPKDDVTSSVELDALWRLGQFNYSIKAEKYGLLSDNVPVDGGIIPTDNEIPFLFDVALPIKPQMKKAEELLQSMQRDLLGKKISASKTEHEKLPVYLQLLDADARDVEDNVIKEILFRDKEIFTDFDKHGKLYKKDRHRSPRSDALRDYRKGAYGLLTGGYRLL